MSEQLGAEEQALEHVSAVLADPVHNGGDPKVCAYILAHGVRGRVLSARGDAAAAEVALEAAVAEAEGRQRWLLAAMALRCVPSRPLAIQERNARAPSVVLHILRPWYGRRPAVNHTREPALTTAPRRRAATSTRMCGTSPGARPRQRRGSGKSCAS